jgi:outer membrane biogenesis lipoprotein LolB
MSLRSITVLAALILLQACGCATASKPSGPSANELERRHDEMMQRMGGGSGSGM